MAESRKAPPWMVRELVRLGVPQETYDQTCGGLGSLECEYGTVECPGCEDCLGDEDDYDLDDYDLSQGDA